MDEAKDSLDDILKDYARFKAAEWVFTASYKKYPDLVGIPDTLVQLDVIPKQIRNTILSLFPSVEGLELLLKLGDIPREIWNTIMITYSETRRDFMGKIAKRILGLMEPKYDMLRGLTDQTIETAIDELEKNNLDGDAYLLLNAYLPNEYINIYKADPTNDLNSAVRKKLILGLLSNPGERRRRLNSLQFIPKTIYVSNLVYRNLYYDKRVVQQLVNEMLSLIERHEPLGETEKQALKNVVETAAKIRSGETKKRYNKPPTLFSDIGAMLPRDEYLENPSIAVTRLLALVFSGQFSAQDWENLRIELFLQAADYERDDDGEFTMDIWNIQSPFLRKIVPGTASELVLRRLLDTTFFTNETTYTFDIDFLNKKAVKQKELQIFDSGRVLIQGLQMYLLQFRDGILAEETSRLFLEEHIQSLYEKAMHPAYLERIKATNPYQGWKSWLVDQMKTITSWFSGDIGFIDCVICGDATSTRCSCKIDAYLCEPCFKIHLNQK